MDVLRTAIILQLLALCTGLFFGSEPEWNGLQVTWGVNPFGTWNFDDLPRTVSEALEQGFVAIDNGTSCSRCSPFSGIRYVKDNDYVVILIFDINGFIAGMQSSVPPTNTYPPQQLIPPFVQDGDRYVITVYFVDPATICSPGRSSEEFEAQGTGSQLYIQNGPDYKSTLLVALDQSAVDTSIWTEGKCFYTMGKHYWYNVSKDMSCDEFFPIFLLYNGGRLDGFGFGFIQKLSSPRFEHPPSSMFPLFMKEMPTCLDGADVSTMHVFLTKHALNNFC